MSSADNAKKSARRILLMFVSIQTFTLIAFSGLSIAANELHKRALSEAVSIPVRRSIIAGDLRTAINDLSALVGHEFAGAQFVSNVTKGVELSVPAHFGSQSPTSSFLQGVHTIPLRFEDGSDRSAGDLVFAYKRFDYALYGLILWGLSILFFVPFLHRERRRLQEEQEQVKRDATAHVLASMVGMISHDVRKPITMTKIVLEMLVEEQDPAELKAIAALSFPEIERAMSSVSGLLSDILEIGSKGQPVRKAVNPEALVRETLDEALKSSQKPKPLVELSFGHLRDVNVDRKKVARVFLNIIGNALDLMPAGERLWIKTQSEEKEGKGFVKFTLGNSGTSIPQADLPHLFETFYTKREGGTGLGLAIAEKVVKDHGGKIWAESTANSVEFVFLLPSQ